MTTSNARQVASAVLTAGSFGCAALLPLRADWLGLRVQDQLQTLGLVVYAYAGVALLAALLAARWAQRNPASLLQPTGVGLSLYLWLATYIAISFRGRGPISCALGASVVALAACAAVGALIRRAPRAAEPAAYGGLLLACLLYWIFAASSSPAALQSTPATAWLWVVPALAFAGYFALGALATFAAPVRAAAALVLALGVAGTSQLVMHARPAAALHAGAHAPKHIVLMSIDTLRSDHLGAYGNRTVKTPFIDAFAKQGVVFDTTITAIGLTNPSHTTMLTGVYPGEHGVEGNGPMPMSAAHPSLPRLLAKQGYTTVGFVSAAVLDRRLSKLPEQFQAYDDNLGPLHDMPQVGFRTSLLALLAGETGKHTLLRDERRGDETVSAALGWLERNAQQPFFMFLHLYDPHGEYGAPSPYDRMYDPQYEGKPVSVYKATPAEHRSMAADPKVIAHLKAAYAGEVSFADVQVGRVLSQLRKLGILDDTLFVLTADHGESLSEHGYYFDHSEDMYEPTLHVPLIIRMPKAQAAGQRVTSLTSLVDLTPTILDVAGVQSGAHFSGISLLPEIEQRAVPTPERTVFTMRFSPISVDRARLLSVRSLSYKFIRTSQHLAALRMVPGSEELYELGSDPGELTNRIDRDGAVVRQFSALADPPWRDWLGETRGASNSTLQPRRAADGGNPDADAVRALKSLGYVR